MQLHFNLWYIFVFCMGLMVGQAICSNALILAIVLMLAYVGYLYKRKMLSFVDGIFGLSFLLNLWFCVTTSGNVYQYDYFNFYMHADYFIMNDFFVKNPKMYLSSVYFQPPLWGGIAGLVTNLMMVIGKTKEAGFDFIRFINLFAVSGAGIIFWRLIKKIEINDKVALWCFIFYGFFPTLSIFSGLVNNDAMTYFLMLSIVYLAFCWYEKGDWKNTFLIMLCLLLGGMIKFSALMVVAGLGVLILYKLLNNKKDYKHILSQSFVIGMGAILGFLWGFFLLYYNIPLVPPPNNNIYQDMSLLGITDRLFSLDTLFVPFVNVRAGILENNVWLSLIKTSLFGEWAWNNIVCAYVMYVIGIIFVIISVVSFFSLLKIKLGKDFAFNLFVVILIFAVIISWIGFWLEYQYFSSTEYRYVAILLPLSLLWIANWWQKICPPKWINYIMTGLIVVFVIAKFMLYLSTI